MRITRPGLDFIGTNLGSVASKVLGKAGGIYSIDIPKSAPEITAIPIPIVGGHIVHYIVNICPNSPNPSSVPPQCIADIGIGNAQLKMDAVTPNSLRISGTLPVRLKDLPIDATSQNALPDINGLHIGVGTPDPAFSNGCSGSTPHFDYKAFPLDITLPIVAETIAPRTGFSKIDIGNAIINADIQSGDVSICGSCFLNSFPGCGSGVCCDAVFNFIKNQAFGTLKTKVTDALKSQLADALCSTPDPTLTPQCPTGTEVSSDKKFCVFSTAKTQCVSKQLGTDGHVDLGSALASISPGSSGGLNFVLAGAGAMDAAPNKPADNTGYPGHTPNGLTLAMLGGAIAAPQSTCVPAFKNTPPVGIPLPDEMKLDTQTPWPMGTPQPDMGIALAGRFLNYTFGSIYNSGLLCLGVSTEQFQQLQSGLLSVLIPSIKNLTLEQKGASVAITTRPQVPPTVKIGTGKDIKTDPLLAVELKQFAVDFYVWSDDRYVRAFTFTGDLTIPINLSTAKDAKTNPNGGLLPVLGDIAIANPVVSNSDLLLDDPATIASSLSAILGGLSSQLFGSLKPFDIGAALKSFGMGLTIPDGGIRKLSKGTDDYLAIFGNLALSKSAVVEADTEARIIGKTVHPEAMALGTINRDKLPELQAIFSSPLDNGAHLVEYAWAIDEGSRSGWMPDRQVTVKSDYLVFQGKHTLKVWAREVGQQESEDSTPALVPFTIDTLAPKVTVKEATTGTSAVTAWDFVSDDSALVGRYRVTKDGQVGEFGEWAPVAALANLSTPGAVSVDVEVRDEEGNVGTVSSALIRGRPDPSLAAAGGCGCSTPGSTNASGAWGLVALGGLFAAGAGRRWRRRTARSLRSTATAVGLGTVAFVASTSQGCSCADANAVNAEGCGADCKQVCNPALPQGLIGAYTSVAKAKDGTLWVAGYNDAVVSPDENHLYGDLVVGKYDAAKQAVAWQTVDGVAPRTDGSCPDNQRDGWRGGETEAGDDVGRYTNILLDPQDRPMVSYFDDTHTALKFASYDGEHWASYTVTSAPGSDIGRYAKMTLVAGNPVIAFLVMEKGNGGHMRSKVALAKASTATPRAPSDWAFEDAVIDDNGPCRAQFCDATDACVISTGICTPKVDGCTPVDCGKGNACVTTAGKATCEAIADTGYVEALPSAFGDYISMVSGPQGLGIVVYDRYHGNLVGVSNSGSAWVATTLDGETGSRASNSAKDTGDVGVAASLAITSNGDWHVSYINGITERLQYMSVPGGKTGLKPEIIDDGAGLGVGAPPFPDGLHIIGDDSNIQVDDNTGTVTVTYQDSTVGELRIATGAVSGATHMWSVKTVPQPNRFAGFFPVPVPGMPQIANWWRTTDHTAKTISGDVAFITP
ncbi:MAG: hypothetical protein ABIP39_11755 [Polyangiaceae bacterium]